MAEEEDGGGGRVPIFLHSYEIKSASGLETKLRVCITLNYCPPQKKSQSLISISQ